MAKIVGIGLGKIDVEEDVLNIPENSEVYARMKGNEKGEFKMVGTDGLSYNYVY